MTRRPVVTPTQAAAKATEAADALMAWLQTQPQEARRRSAAVTAAGEYGIETDTGSDAAGAASASTATVAPPEVVDPSGAATAVPTYDLGRDEDHAPLRLPSRACALAHTDWLYHRLSIAGPVADLTEFRAAAAGAGTVPWHLDLDRMAEDYFHLLAAPPARAGSLLPSARNSTSSVRSACGFPVRSLSLTGARILADQLCAAVAQRHALAIGRVGNSRACPLDLHALVPVPDAVLRRGPDDAEALDWLWAHWGTTQPLRHVADDETVGAATRIRLAPGEGVWAVSFWSADWTPWRALAQMMVRWPSLRFDMRPVYETL